MQRRRRATSPRAKSHPAAREDLLQPGSTNDAIHFSGSGFMLPFQFGAVAALRAHDIKFTHASASSGGVMAALAILDAADLELGVRQCMDLRVEPSTTPSSVKAFFAVYRQYFRCFPDSAHQKKMPIDSIRGRLWVRLGKLTLRGLEVFSVGDFASEKELEDAFMSAAYIPGGTSVTPPMFRERVALDAVLIDTLRWRPSSFSLREDSLWPPTHAAQMDGVRQDVELRPGGRSAKRCMVVTFAPIRTGLLCGLTNLIDATGLVAVQGTAHGLLHFWASPAKMKEGFIEGYVLMAARIERPPPAAGALSAREEASALLERILEEQADWKVARGFTKPALWIERDPLLIFLFVVALAVAVCLHLTATMPSVRG